MLEGLPARLPLCWVQDAMVSHLVLMMRRMGSNEAPDGKDGVGTEDGKEGGGERGIGVRDDPTNQPRQARIGCRTYSLMLSCCFCQIQPSCSPAVVKIR